MIYDHRDPYLLPGTALIYSLATEIADQGRGGPIPELWGWIEGFGFQPCAGAIDAEGEES